MTSSNTQRRIIAIVPAYNEERTIGKVVSELRAVSDVVVVVDDGSTDRTAFIAEHAGARVLRNTVNLGYDRSIDGGFKEAKKHGATIVVTCDGDGQHRIEDIKRVLEPVVAGEADIGVGLRGKPGGVGEKAFMFYTKWRFGISDPLCGLKAYTIDVYNTIGWFDRLSSIGTELLLRAVQYGYAFKEIPIFVKERSDTSRFYAQRIRANIRICRALLYVIITI